MKKHLASVLSLCLLAISGGVISSCSSDELGSTEDVLAESVKKYGTHSSGVNLYFGGAKITGTTRACDVNGNMWGDATPAYPTDDEVSGVLAYIQSNPGAQVEWPGYTYYFVQHVTGAHNQYSYTDYNGAFHGNIDGTSHLDWLGIQEDRELNSWEIDANGNPYSWVDLYTHVNNFNSGKCDNAATHNAALMTQGFKGARVHDSYGNTNVDNWRLYYWNGNYYLAFDYEMSKDDGSVAPNGIYDDWIVKILPGKGETPVTPDVNPDPKPNPDVNPDATTGKGEVEFDIHQQIHQTWNEIKTSIHVRDTTAVHVFIPIPMEYQAVADDFAIRTGDAYKYGYTEEFGAQFTFAGKDFTFPVKITHSAAGIDIYIDCTTDEAKEALKLARGVFDDGITFEINSYVTPNATSDQIWGWLKTVKLPSTKTSQWPQDGDICTHVYGQVSSAYYPGETIRFDQRP